MSDVILLLTIICTLGSGLIAGVFFAFSSFVMPALARTTSPHGAEAMQYINITVINPLMMGTFLGTGVLCLLLAGLSLWTADTTPWLTLLASAFYIFGTVGVTIAFNVPMNDELAPMRLDDAATAGYWQHYLTRWTRWNTFRTVAATVACLAYVLSLQA